MSIQLLGVRIDELASHQVLQERLHAMLDEPGPHMIVTPNPEILLYARNDPAFRTALNRAELSLPDGIGISLVSLIRSRRKLKRSTGIDTAEALFAIAETQGLTVLVLGGRKGSASRAARNLQKRFQGVRIFTAGEDICFQKNGNTCEPGSESHIIETIERFAPSIIFVGLGAPKQERWMERHYERFSSVRIMMGVGGAFDIWSGDLKRAPKTLRTIGLEWLWRLFQEPWRLRRILRATILFPWYAIIDNK